MAEEKISQLPEAKNMVPTDLLAVVSEGDTEKATLIGMVMAALIDGLNGNTAAGTALLRITQQGAGYALLVEDEASPDTTPTAIHASGGISVGNTTDPGANNVYVSGYVAASIATLLTELIVNRSGGGEVMRLRGDSSVGTYPVFSVSINEAASLVSLVIGTVDTTSPATLAFVGHNVTRWTMTTSGDLFPRQGAVGMKDGFMFIPSGGGAPTDIPTNENTGITPLYYDEANNILYAYNAGWKSVAMT
jgi:hypothetical protein